MAVANYPPIQPYVKGQRGALPQSDIRYLENELLKIQKTLQDILVVIKDLETKVTFP